VFALPDWFSKKHPAPHQLNQEHLYKYFKFDDTKLSYLEKLFVEGKLYHSLPTVFNDPFECKPRIVWPTAIEKLDGLIQDVQLIGQIFNWTNEVTIRAFLKLREDPIIREQFESELVRQFESFRICCFTTCNKKLLFWSHYADSHRGFCVRFNVKDSPLAQSYKVHYSDNYPSLRFPMFSEMGKLMEPVLTKSKDWEYEGEYRSVFKPSAPLQLGNDGESILLKGSEISDVYFGLQMAPQDRDKVISIINGGIFKPRLWEAIQDRGAFTLSFREL
jgi:hypothetical protein